MNLKELQNEVKRLSKRANQRLVRLEQQGLTSDYSSYGRVKRYGFNRFGQVKRIEKGLTDNRSKRAAYIKEIARINNFLDAETSTVTDYKKYKKRTNKLLGVESKDTKEADLQTDEFFQLYDELKRIYYNTTGLRYLEFGSGENQAFGVVKEFLNDKNYKRKTKVSLKRYVRNHLRIGGKKRG